MAWIRRRSPSVREWRVCFSASASFVTAAIVGAIGFATLRRVRERRAIMLAFAPLLFAAQQSVEGLLWLALPRAPDGPASTALTIAFLFFAEVWWPVYTPFAVLLIEPTAVRRRAMLLCLAVGIGVAAYMSWGLANWTHRAHILDGHIVYASEYPSANPALLLYLAATALPLLLASHGTVRLLGVIVFIGAAIAHTVYREAFVSVWCFFAAAASVIVLGHFERVHRQRPAVALITRSS